MKEYNLFSSFEGYADFRIDKTVHLGTTEPIAVDDITGIEGLNLENLCGYGDVCGISETYQIDVKESLYGKISVPYPDEEVIFRRVDSCRSEKAQAGMKVTGIITYGEYEPALDNVDGRKLPIMIAFYDEDFDTDFPEDTIPYAIGILLPVKVQGEKTSGWATGCVSITDDETVYSIFKERILPYKRKVKNLIEKIFSEEGDSSCHYLISKGRIEKTVISSNDAEILF